ncbi:MAG: c-type cytochrome [Elusimicrobia bacterium]|nr:c-type cytochrome [Elusimicrobiota bacterium]
MKNFFVGIAAAGVAALIGAYFFVIFGLMPANADANPSALERWAAHKSLHATIARQAPKGPNPVALSDENMTAGVKLYAANCAVCHGAADHEASNVALGLYQKPPQLAKDDVTDDPEGATYWKVYHGIRMTGMPSFAKTLSETQIWQLALFLKHMKELSPAVQKAWQAVPSQKTPAA